MQLVTVKPDACMSTCTLHWEVDLTINVTLVPRTFAMNGSEYCSIFEQSNNEATLESSSEESCS